MSPEPDTAESKASIRARMREALDQLTPAARAADSALLRDRLGADPEFRAAGWVLGFIPLRSEPDLLSLITAAAAAGRTVLLPRWDPAAGEYFPAIAPHDGSLVPGPFGIPQPAPEAAAVPHDRLDLILVPGLAFDREGRRIGRGKGFYDRLLAKAPQARKWGVAFDLQIVDEIPIETHDVNLDRIATPSRWLQPGTAGNR